MGSVDPERKLLYLLCMTMALGFTQGYYVLTFFGVVTFLILFISDGERGFQRATRDSREAETRNSRTRSAAVGEHWDEAE